MTFRALLSRAAVRTLDAVDRPTEARLRDQIKRIAADPFDPRVSKPLAHPKGYRSARVGGWRILFIVDAGQHTVDVVSIESRGQVYRRL